MASVVVALLSPSPMLLKCCEASRTVGQSGNHVLPMTLSVAIVGGFIMHGIIYLIGLVVVILFILSALGLR